MRIFHCLPDAQIVFCKFDAPCAGDWCAAYDRLVTDIRREVRAAMPSFDLLHGWRGCGERVLLRNPYADVGITTEDGVGCVWIAERDDRDYRLQCEWIDLSARARRWLAEIAPNFAAVTTRLGCSPTLPIAGADAPWLQAA